LAGVPYRAKRRKTNLMLKGALHIHSTYSDGEFTLAEIRNVFLDKGCSFVCMTDHAEYFDELELKAYSEECNSLSDEKLRFVVGLEYRCEKEMHILGYGATMLAKSQDPQTIIRHIDAQGAISVIAHPKNESFSWIESFERLPQGIETWNSKYDGRYAPRPGTFALVRRLVERQPDMHAFYGQDLHWKKQFRGLFVHVDCESARPDNILRALSAGEFNGQKGELKLPSSGVLQDQLIARFSRSHDQSRRVQRALKEGKRALNQAGIKVPDSIKAQLRRIL
jgi:PHP domain